MPQLPPVLWQRLVPLYRGKVTLWIDQSGNLSDPLHDIRNLKLTTKEQLIRSLQELLFKAGPSATTGQCMAIAYDWIRNGIQMGGDFISDFRGATSLHYRLLQMRHRIDIFAQKQSYSYLKMRKKLLGIAKDLDRLSSTMQSRQQVKSLEQDVQRSEKEFEKLRLKVYQPSFSEFDGVHIWGMTDKMLFALASDICQVLKSTELQGWFLLAVEGGVLKSEGGHAFGLRFWDSTHTFQLIDANTGLFEFSRRADLLKFFDEVLWEHIYSGLYNAGRFRLVRYSLYPSLD